jgi:hypothetical protein
VFTTPAVTSVINRYYDPTTGMFFMVDPDVGITGQPYSYVGDDPIDSTDPLGLCNNPNEIGYYPGACATTAAGALTAEPYIQSHAGGGGWSLSNATKALADYGAGIGNFVTSTATLGQVHVSDPYCGFGWAYGVGYGYGAVGTALLGLGEADAADAADVTRVGRWMSPTEFDSMTQTGTVQEGAGGVTSVANPATPDAYMQ